MKTISVILCTYNGEKYLKEQLDSIIAQTYPLHEIIIQDDGSTDSTVEICKEYEATYPQIHLFQNECNLGYNLNFKSAAMRATGDYVAISDQDDVWFPTKIEKQVSTIGTNDMCFSSHLRGATQANSHLVSPQYSMEALLFNGFAGHTMLLRRDFIQTAEYWLPYLIYDWSLAINAQLHGGIVKIEEPLNWHRTNLDSACHVEQREKGFKNGHPSYQPYLFGISNYRKLQNKENWQLLYTYIYKHTKDTRFSYVHKMVACMLSKNPLSLLHLCWLCLKRGKEIYYSANQKGFMGKLRQFCYPLIFSYNNLQYDRK